MNRPVLGYVCLLLILLATSFISIRLFLQERTDHDRLDIRKFPQSIGEWAGRDLEIKEYEYKILETRNLVSREYVNGAGEKIYLFIIYSETNRSVFHPPEVCMIGSGMNLTDKKTETIGLGRMREFRANKLYAQKDGYKEIALYSYKSGALYTDNFYLQQAHFAFNQLLGKNRGGATVRVSMRVGGSEDAAVAKLKSFMGKAVLALESLSRH